MKRPTTEVTPLLIRTRLAVTQLRYPLWTPAMHRAYVAGWLDIKRSQVKEEK